MELTEEQRRIVDERRRDVVVTAGAGSGKTRVLVERYLSLLGDHRIPDIAAVTFTDAAAVEMRDRVRREVLARPDLAPHRSELDKAAIGTIHSLCLRVLREHPVEAGIDPGSRVLSDDEAEFETITACVDALEAAADADDHRALALREVGVFALTNRLPQMVARRDEIEEAYRALQGSGPDWADLIRGRLDADCRTAVEEGRPQLVEWAAWLRGAHAGPGQDALSTRLAEALEALGDPAEGDWDDLMKRAIDAGSKIKLQGGRAGNWRYPVADVREAMGRLRNTAQQLEKIPRWNEHDGPALEALSSLHSLFGDACARYAARKREMAALDYLDLEIEAARMLRSHPNIAAEYRSRFHHLMVDELQDTNPAQVALLDLLSRDGSAAAPGPERFFVGDVKQAIYRFRGSDVRNFTRLKSEVESNGAVHALGRSFRAHDALVETLNVLFDAVFADARKEYEAPMQTMKGRGAGPLDPPHLVVMPVSDQTPAGERTGDFDRRLVEADAVAAEAAALLDGGFEVWDGEAGRRRPARASDVAILLRRLANVHLFEQALESHGVAYRTPAGAGFFTRQEVLDLTNLLGWLAEPDDSIALAGALRSPLFMIDDQSLLALRSEGGSLMEALRDPPEGILEKTRPFCQRAAAVLADLRRATEFDSPDAILERSLALTGFEASWAPLQGGEQALANIRKLVGIARTLSDHSLDELVAYLRRRRDELDAREGLAVLDESDAVRLLTIHGAKGLEFPIVFVPEAHLPSRGSYDAVRWRAEEGISLTLAPAADAEERRRRRPGFYSYLLERDSLEEEAEHKRLFYVAATRAADRLYVSGDEGARGDGWIVSVLKTFRASRPDVEVRPAVSVDLKAIASKPAPAVLSIPGEDEEKEFLSTLAARPRVIPLRSSTPVTALRDPAPRRSPGRHGDGLGLFRGSLAHRAIELWFTTGERPPLVRLARTLDEGMDERTAASVGAEVDAMLDLLDASPLAATLREPGTRAHFELPFSWDWDGAPVHGTIDLAYESDGEWRIIDFKTDQVHGGALDEAAAPYLPQLALYASALERATGRRPEAGLLFLRTGDCYAPAARELDEALAEARARIDGGQALETPASSELDESLWDSRRI